MAADPSPERATDGDAESGAVVLLSILAAAVSMRKQKGRSRR